MVKKLNEKLLDIGDENGGHGYVEHASIGNKIVHVFYADDNEGCENNDGKLQ